MRIKNAIVISDTHCGCKLALCPPQGFTLDEGGLYLPSLLQLKIWDMWREFWDVWLPVVTRGEPYIIIHVGDAVDGVHHNSVTQITHNLKDQVKFAKIVLLPEIEKCCKMGGKYYHIRGTEAHVGTSGQQEEALAEMLGAVPDCNGNFARWDLWIEIGDALAHLTHHIGTCGSMAYETSAVLKELEQEFVEAARWGERRPDVIVRAHRHRNVETRIQTDRGFATAFVTAGWQAKTPFVFKVAGGRVSQPQIGGSIIRTGDRATFTEHQVWSIQRPKTVIPEVANDNDNTNGTPNRIETA